jgi:mono/diheme cytochrome c family protein
MRAFVILVAAWSVLTSGVLPPLGAAASPAQPPATAAMSAERDLLNKYCVTCHNRRAKIGGLALDTLDVGAIGEHPDVWEKVVLKLRAGLMPPAGRPRPDKSTYDGLAASLENALDRAAARHLDPGRTEQFHRLNRAEYQNAVRDLLFVDVDVASLLPADDASYGFDNMAGVLKLSPTLLERYVTAAQRVARLAVGIAPTSVSVDTFRLLDDAPQDDWVEGLPFGTRGGTLIKYTFPVDAEYGIDIRLSRLASTGAGEDVASFPESHDLELSVDGERVKVFTLAGEPPPAPGERAARPSRRDIDATWNVRLPIKAGPRTIGVAFKKKSSAVVETTRLPFIRPQLVADTRYEPYLGSVTVSGPFNPRGPGDTPSRRRIFVCRPTSREDGCAKTILSTLARRAYRRPVTDADVQPLLAFYADGGRQAGAEASDAGFDARIERAIELLLTSPEFVFRVESDPPGVAPAAAYPIGDLELASRLSFFLWSSIPDDELLDVAARGKLRAPAMLERQVRRMLDDPRSHALVTNFAGQWLQLRNVPAAVPDPTLFPDFDDSLRQSFRRETELFFESVLREDRSALDLLTANYTFVNERLARHYGIPNIKGSDFRRVTLTDESRFGLLGQGSILTVTAYPHRTSPVLRGKWILENLFGTPPPPPPPNVPDLKDKNAAGAVLTMRDRMAQHRVSAVCASCHSMMDPLGLSLENYDAVGRLRAVDETFSRIDASGVLPDGTAFEGVAGLRAALLARSDRFLATLTAKLLTYALGRGLEPSDMPAVRAIVREASAADNRMSAIVLAIARSVPFEMRRSRS